ncbi:MAG: RNA polymerase sigma factor [Gemmataceae bacterium]
MMKDDPESSSLYIAAAEEIKDSQLRQVILSAIKKTLPRMTAYSKANLGGAVDPLMVLDNVVAAAVKAEVRTPVRDYGPYLFKSFIREARRVLHRATKIEYLAPEELAMHPAASDTSSVEKLEREILTEEALAVLDERTRKICVLWSQRLKPREIAAAVGMSEGAVRKQLARGIERMRRHIQDGRKNEPGPND